MPLHDNGTKRSREELKKERELEEMRKAGTLAPEIDEDGNMINPHIPQYMSRVRNEPPQP